MRATTWRASKTFYDVASYFTINISSPNTPGLRDLQAPAALDELLSRVMAARAALVAAGTPRRPIIVKIAPDIAEDDIAPIVARLDALRVDGIAVSNTTLARARLNDAQQEGGRPFGTSPVSSASTVMLARVYQATGGHNPAHRHRRHRQRCGRSQRSKPAPRCCSSTRA